MKLVTIILSIYMTILAIMPCQDSNDVIARVMQVTLHKSHSPNDERGQEVCPPFCTCNCCSTARTLTAIVTTRVFTKSITREYADYDVAAVQKQPIKIWQPPQIA